MIWPDFKIRQRFHELVPVGKERNEDLINPASFDVRIGRCIQTEKLRKPVSTESPLQAVKVLFSEPCTLHPQEIYWLEPGEMILVSMLERIDVPNDCTMSFYLKSSRAREGYEHANAGWIDPGWQGYLTMELKNNLRSNTLPIYTGLRIGQMKVESMGAEAEKPYCGRYQNATIVESSKPQHDDWVK